MKNIINSIKYVLICISVIIAFSCFTVTLLFGIAGLNAITQAGILQIIALFSFCITFSIVGNSFMIVTERLYKSVRC